MNDYFKRIVCGLLITACVCLLPPTTARADSSSEGAAISAGLFIVVLGVLVIIGIASDVDYFSHHKRSDDSINQIQIDPQTIPGMKALRTANEPQQPVLEFAGGAGGDLGLRIQF